MNEFKLIATINQLITEESVEETVTVLVVENSVGRQKITGRSNIAT